MATFVAAVADVFAFEATSGTTPSFSQGSSNRYLFGGATWVTFGTTPTITDLKHSGSSGTTISANGSDTAFLFGNGNTRAGEVIPGPSGTTTIYTAGTGALQGAAAGVSYEGVDSSSDFTTNSGVAGDVSTTVASVTVPNCVTGQTVTAIVYAASTSLTLTAFTAVSGTTIRADDVGTDLAFVGIAVLEKVASADGNCTLSVNVNSSTSGGEALGWVVKGERLVDTSGGGASGTSATTNANDTGSASGTTTVTGTSARTNANDTSSASGTTTVTGTSARTNANDTSSASGSVGSSVTGTSATTNANDAGAASGTTTVTGTLARANASDTSSASGTTTVVGTLARTNANDTASASGAAGTVSGTAAVTNGNDTAAAVGTTPGPTSNGQSGASPQKRRRRLLDDEPFLEAPQAKPQEPEPPPAPVPTVALPPPQPPKLAEVLKAIPIQQPKPIKAKANAKPAPVEENDDDDLDAIEMAVSLLLH